MIKQFLSVPPLLVKGAKFVAGSQAKISEQSLQQIALRLRKRILTMCAKAGTGHLTSSYSCIEILTALYHGGILRHDPACPDWSDRDRFILSKGQASPALYAVLADRGYFPDEWLDGFAQVGGRMGVHLQQSVPGAEITCGSLGQGFGMAVGMALAAKMDGKGHRIFTMLGDGECWEGAVWEAAAFAAHHRLNNLVAIIDRNQMSVMGKTEEIVALEPLAVKWRAWGWDVSQWGGHDDPDIPRHPWDHEDPRSLSGHRFDDLFWAFKNLMRDNTLTFDRPKVIIAETIKGKGIPEIEGQALWHGVAPKGEEVARFQEVLS